MPEFKVGDTVRVKPGEGGCAPKEIGEIHSLHGDHAKVFFGATSSPWMIDLSCLDNVNTLAHYRDALYAVDPGASNLSGLAHSLSRHMDVICDEARKAGKGTDYVNRHPAVVLMVSQMAFLSKCDDTLTLCEALEVCKAKNVEYEARKAAEKEVPIV